MGKTVGVAKRGGIEPKLGLFRDQKAAHVWKGDAQHAARLEYAQAFPKETQPLQERDMLDHVLGEDRGNRAVLELQPLADVVRRAGIYGPRDYLAIVQELIKYWSIESLDGLNDLGRMAQEKIMGIPARLERIAEIMEKKTKPKSFAFDVVFNRVFAME